VGKTIINNPPVITIFMWYVYHSQAWWFVALFYPHESLPDPSRSQVAEELFKQLPESERAAMLSTLAGK
jgi:hypothetical protein